MTAALASVDKVEYEDYKTARHFLNKKESSSMH
jgi:hypothetical protein